MKGDINAVRLFGTECHVVWTESVIIKLYTKFCILNGCSILIMFANPYRLAIRIYCKPASSQRLIGLALALIKAGSAQAREVIRAPDVPPTIPAARVQATVHLDGDLSETDWQRVVSAHGCRQAGPQQGNPATFDTEVRVKTVVECSSPVGNSRTAVTSTTVIRSTI